MKKIIFISIPFLIIGFLYKFYINSFDYLERGSDSIAESINNEFYIKDLYRNQSYCVFNKDTINIKKVWTEYSWKREYSFLFFEKKIKTGNIVYHVEYSRILDNNSDCNYLVVPKNFFLRKKFNFFRDNTEKSEFTYSVYGQVLESLKLYVLLKSNTNYKNYPIIDSLEFNFLPRTTP